MSNDAATARADLAYLKALVEGDGRFQHAFGLGYCFAGLAYGLQVILQWADYAEVLPLDGTAYLAVVTLPTAALIALLTWQGLKSRKVRVANPANRAVSALFQAAGLANLAVIAVLLVLTQARQDGVFILLYGAIVFILQGACWYVVWRLQRRLWMLGVALGWFASGVAMGLSLVDLRLDVYLAIATFDLFLLMALPGAVILLNARRSAP